MKLANRQALVTGADSGIGQAIAREFAHEGAHVAVFLPSGEASYVTGSSYFVDGGLMLMTGAGA